MEPDRPVRPSFDKFKSIKPKAVSLPQDEGIVRARPLREGELLPLLVEPAIADADLVEWAQENKALLEEKLSQHGALLFRGFGIDSVERFEAFSRSLCHELFDENGEHQNVAGSVQTPVFYPADKQLLWHNENSFNHTWPGKIIFCCVQAPEQGGETPVVDSRKIFERLDPELRQRFLDKGVMYQRNYGGGLGLDWQTVFRTTDRAEVEEKCRQGHFEYRWKDGDRLMTRGVRPAVVRHPRTGELTWFTQAQHWHVSCLDPETRDSLRALYAEEDMPRNCYYGDGTPIADEDMQSILDAYRDLEAVSPWQRGDVMVVDNLLAAHGRNPYVGTRKILVTLGDMMSFDQV
jgi:alpha-ketoglutarate-dependent taurine dioxygenase